MQHLLNFINEIQHLPITEEKYYGLAPGEKSEHIHHSKLKKGQKYDHECTRNSISGYYISDEYNKKLYDLLHAALTEVLLLSKEQQLNVIARLRNINSGLVEVEEFLSEYYKTRSGDNFGEHELYRIIRKVFPLLSFAYNKPDSSFKSIFHDFILHKITAINFLKNSIGDNQEIVSSFNKYGEYTPPEIDDPYLIIECGISGIFRIGNQYKNQLKEIKRFPADKEPPYLENDRESWRVLNNFYITQKLPFIDFLQFRIAVRKLILNSSNLSELKTIFKEVYSQARNNIDTYINHIQVLEKIERKGKFDNIPDEYKGVKVESQSKFLTFGADFRTTIYNKDYSEKKGNQHTEYYRNRDLAIYSESVYLFLKNEVYKEPGDNETEREIPDLQEKRAVVKTINIKPEVVIKLYERIQGYFDKPELLLSALQGEIVDDKIVYEKTAKDLVSIFNYLLQKQAIDNSKDKLAEWIGNTFHYTMKKKPMEFSTSTILKYLNNSEVVSIHNLSTIY